MSTVVLDRNDRLMRAYQVADGRWRLPVAPGQVDRGYLSLLFAYEDRRFHDHAGVDPLAIARAIGQAVWNGKAVSGASTLTMQVARLLQERPTRTLTGKLEQIRLALALERRLDKSQVLELYLKLAPFGGNIEGIRAASLTWFGKEPARLTPAEAALLVALPQSPEARRPDRHPKAARRARDRVLDRAVAAGVLAPAEAQAARSEPVPTKRRAFPALSPHLADRIHRAAPDRQVHRLTLDRTLQRDLQALISASAQALPPHVSAAVIVADHRTGEILASVGSAGLTDERRRGYVDMTQAVRSPGSTLKPFIYGLAFEHGLAHPESLVEDRPTSFAGYVPTNFDDGYHGTVSLRSALQRSLNVPAVVLLDAVGPARLLATMSQGGARPVLPPGRGPGLAIGLGGVGLTLQDLVGLYAGLARGGQAITLSAVSKGTDGARLFGGSAAWHVADILAGAAAPVAASNGQLAYKTGTSYGYRDAWAVGFDGAHVIGVWVGRADAAPVPGITGIKTAAPILFQALNRLKPAPDPLAPPPPDTLVVRHAELPAPLRRVRSRYGQQIRPGPQIAFPPDGARVEVRGPMLALKVRDGRAPFTWIVNGRPVETMALSRESAWRPDGRGFVSISVIDATGAAASAKVFLQ